MTFKIPFQLKWFDALPLGCHIALFPLNLCVPQTAVLKKANSEGENQVLQKLRIFLKAKITMCAGGEGGLFNLEAQTQKMGQAPGYTFFFQYLSRTMI